jgi:hypothetical protein
MMTSGRHIAETYTSLHESMIPFPLIDALPHNPHDAIIHFPSLFIRFRPLFIRFRPLFIHRLPGAFLAGTCTVFPLHTHIPHHHVILSSSPFRSSLYMMPRYPTTRRTSQSNDRRRFAQRTRQIRTAVTNPPTAVVVPRSSHALPSVSDPVPPTLPPLACRPLTPLAPSLRHTLRTLSEVICASCGVLHWIEERASNTSKTEPLFSTCCGKGKISLPPLLDLPEPLHSLLHEATLGR